MANTLANSSSEERLDINFAVSSAVDLRAKPAKFWRVLGGGRLVAEVSSAHVDAYIFEAATIFVYQQRAVLVAATPGAAVAAGLALLWRYPEARLETVVYQSQGSRDFRKNFGRLRDEAGDRLGPAVVTDETVLFHPGSRRARPLLTGSRSCIHLRMEKLSPKIEPAFHRVSLPQRRAAVRMLGLESLLKSFDVVEHHFTPSGFVFAGVSGEEYFTLHASGSGARFEFAGRLRPEVGVAITRLLSVFAPREHTLEALNGTREMSLACIPGTHWEPQPLGQHDARFILRPSAA